MRAAKFPAVHPAALEHLQNNLRGADAIPDHQLAALTSLTYVDVFLATLGIERAALERLRRALYNVHDGHDSSGLPYP